MIPIVLWLLWQHPRWRLPFLVVFAIHLGLVLLTGLGNEWIGAILLLDPIMQTWIFNVGPSRIIGVWWLVIGIPLAAWSLTRGRVGWAGLLASPYLNPYYLLFALLPNGKDAEVARMAITMRRARLRASDLYKGILLWARNAPS